MAMVRGDKIGQEFCRAVGINPYNVSFFQITCEAGKVASIKLERWIDSEEAGILRKIVSNYTLEEIKT